MICKVLLINFILFFFPFLEIGSHTVAPTFPKLRDLPASSGIKVVHHHA